MDHLGLLLNKPRILSLLKEVVFRRNNWSKWSSVLTMELINFKLIHVNYTTYQIKDK
jgi:hypothetical protein